MEAHGSAGGSAGGAEFEDCSIGADDLVPLSPSWLSSWKRGPSLCDERIEEAPISAVALSSFVATDAPVETREEELKFSCPPTCERMNGIVASLLSSFFALLSLLFCPRE